MYNKTHVSATQTHKLYMVHHMGTKLVFVLPSNTLHNLFLVLLHSTFWLQVISRDASILVSNNVVYCQLFNKAG